jgi:hypothetical protein
VAKTWLVLSGRKLTRMKYKVKQAKMQRNRRLGLKKKRSKQQRKLQRPPRKRRMTMIAKKTTSPTMRSPRIKKRARRSQNQESSVRLVKSLLRDQRRRAKKVPTSSKIKILQRKRKWQRRQITTKPMTMMMGR